MNDDDSESCENLVMFYYRLRDHVRRSRYLAYKIMSKKNVAQ